MAKKQVGVLSLQGAVLEHSRKLLQCKALPVEVRRPGDLDSLDGLIIPGGESTTIGMLMEKFALHEAIKKCCHNGMGIMGTCAGMVLLAQDVVDGKPEQPKLELMDIAVRRNAFGRQRESFEEELSIKGIESSVRGVFIRAPLVEETGSRVEVLSTVEEGIVAVRQEKILGVSFHPELTEETALHRYFLNLL